MELRSNYYLKICLLVLVGSLLLVPGVLGVEAPVEAIKPPVEAIKPVDLEYKYESGDKDLVLNVEGGNFKDVEGKTVLQVEEGAIPELKFDNNGEEVTVKLEQIDKDTTVELNKLDNRLVITKDGKDHYIPLSNLPKGYKEITFKVPNKVKGFAVIYAQSGDEPNKIILSKDILQTDDDGRLNILENDNNYKVGEVTFGKDTKNARYLRGIPESITIGSTTTNYKDGDYVWGSKEGDAKFTSGRMSITPNYKDDLAHGEKSIKDGGKGRVAGFVVLNEKFGGNDDAGTSIRIYDAVRGNIERGSLRAEIIHQNELRFEFETKNDASKNTIVLDTEGDGKMGANIGPGIVNVKLEYVMEQSITVTGSGLTGGTQVFSNEGKSIVLIKKGSTFVNRQIGGTFSLKDYPEIEINVKPHTSARRGLPNPNDKGKLYFNDDTHKFYAYRDGKLYIGTSANPVDLDCDTCPINFVEGQITQQIPSGQSGGLNLIQVPTRVNNQILSYGGNINYKNLKPEQQQKIMNGILLERKYIDKPLVKVVVEEKDALQGVTTYYKSGKRIFYMVDRNINEYLFCESCTNGAKLRAIEEEKPDPGPQSMWQPLTKAPLNK